jgi:hypothetical protein
MEDRCVPAALFVSSSADDVNQAGTLRWAVAHAQDGDVIYILPTDGGAARDITLTHGELFLSRDVTITSLGRDRAVIDGNYSSRVFEVARGASVDLQGLFIVDGNARAKNSLGNSGLDGDGGGILNEGWLTVGDCWVGNNGSTRFGAKNRALKAGGGIYNYHGDLVVRESSVDDNFAGAGGGIYNDRGKLSMTLTTLAGNSAGGGGGAICNALGVVSVDGNSTLFANAARNGGAIYSDGGEVTVNGSDLERNTAGLYGGALMVTDGQMTVTASTLKDNQANSGGGIYSEVGQLVVTDSALEENSAKADGGGIASRGGEVLVDGSTLTSNSAGHGGGIWDHHSTVKVINQSRLYSNTADYGGGIYNWQGDLSVSLTILKENAATHQGGGIYNSHGTVEVGSSVLELNTAAEGGSIYNDGNVMNVMVGGSTFEKNSPNNGIAGAGYNDLGNNLFI